MSNNEKRKNRFKPLKSEEITETSKSEEYIDISDNTEEKEKLPYVPYKDEKHSLFETEDFAEKMEVKEPDEEVEREEKGISHNEFETDIEPEINVIESGEDSEEVEPADTLDDFEVTEELMDSIVEEDDIDIKGVEESTYSEEDLEDGWLDGGLTNSSEKEIEEDPKNEENQVEEDYLDFTEEYKEIESTTLESELSTDDETPDLSQVIDSISEEVDGEELETSDTNNSINEDFNEISLEINDEEDYMEVLSQEDEVTKPPAEELNEEDVEVVEEKDTKKPSKKKSPLLWVGVGLISIIIIGSLILIPLKGYKYFSDMFSKNIEEIVPTISIDEEDEDFTYDFSTDEKITTEETEELKENLLPLFEEFNAYIDGVFQTNTSIIIEGEIVKGDDYEISRLVRWSQMYAYEFMVDDIVTVQAKIDKGKDNFFYETGKPVIEFLTRLNYEDRHSSQLWWEKSTTLRNGINMKKDLTKNRMYVDYLHPIYNSEVKDDEKDSTEEEKDEAELTKLGSGEFTVGDDIPEGRYTVSTKERSGNLIINQGTIGMVNEIIGTSGVQNVTVNLKKGDKINIKGLNEAVFTPIGFEGPVDKEEQEKPKAKGELTDLGSGTFVVGEDIKEGRYVVSTEEESGNLIIEGDSKTTNEILGVKEVNNITVNLDSGDEINISGLNKVTFTPK